MEILSVQDLKTYFYNEKCFIRAVDGASYTIKEGETLCLIGESGSGKSVSALSILGLIDTPPGIVEGTITYKGNNLLADLGKFVEVKNNNNHFIVEKDIRGWNKKHRDNLRGIRGKEISIIFQDPTTSLSPLFTIGEQIIESLKNSHPDISDNEAREIALRWLKKVKLPNSEDIFHSYSFQLSGGMCQRAMIAVALASQPSLLIADEPTTALDATVQLEILELLKSLQDELGISILLITHDINIGILFADTIAVMYSGRIVEYGPKDAVLKKRANNHPCTTDLLKSALVERDENEFERFVKSNIQDATIHIEGCKYHPRCEVMETLTDGGTRCKIEEPYGIEVENEHYVRCWKYEDVNERKAIVNKK